MNGDTFRDRRDVRLPVDADLWLLSDIAVTRMRRALERQGGQIVTTVTATAEGGTELRRDSLHAAKQALDENDLQPAVIHHTYELYINPGGVESAVVHTTSGFPGSMTVDGTVITIAASGSNKLIVDGLIAEAERVLSKIENGVQSGESLVSLTSSSEPAAPSPAELQTLVEPTTEAHTRATEGENLWEWLKRTRREHAARFFITTIGGVLVLGVAGWLGLN